MRAALAAAGSRSLARLSFAARRMRLTVAGETPVP